MGFKITLLMSIALIVALPNAIAESGLQDEGSENATKRGVFSFGLMVYRVTKRNPLDFVGYGCFCGIGGKGKPVDDLDRCCQVHDECYHKLQKSKVCPRKRAVYYFSYSTGGRRNPTKCKPASYYWFWGKCRNRLCECDAAAAICFKKSRYQEKYRKYPQKKCKNDKP